MFCLSSLEILFDSLEFAFELELPVWNRTNLEWKFLDNFRTFKAAQTILRILKNPRSLLSHVNISLKSPLVKLTDCWL